MQNPLETKINFQSIHEARKIMIREQKLHINEMITYLKFKMLHNQYASQISEEEFARYFLDIDYITYYKLSRGTKKNVTILTKEYYEQSELLDIKRTIYSLEEYDFLDINYEELVSLHKTYGDRLSLKMFAYIVFGINEHTVDDIKSNYGRRTKIKPIELDNELIEKTRDKIINERHLHFDDDISYEEFKEIYVNFPIPQMDEREYALEIFHISCEAFRRFRKDPSNKTKILYNYPLDPKLLVELRRKVIINENLHMEDKISYERFEELYNKYSGILSREYFAIEVLDVQYQALQKAKRINTQITILTKIQITEEYISELRIKIMAEKSLKYNQLLSYKDFQNLYNEYGFPLSERMFATEILGIPNVQYYYSMRTGERNACYIFADCQDVDFKEIRARMILENKLHYDDKITYRELKRLHNKYAPNVRENVFAREALDITQSMLDHIRIKKENTASILLGEMLPSKEEIQDIRDKVKKKYGLHKKDKLTFEQIENMYKEFGGIMPIDMFALQILDININILYKLRANPNCMAQIYIRTEFTKQEIDELRTNVMKDYKLYPGKRIDMNRFLQIYYEANHILMQSHFATDVLGIKISMFQKFKKGEISDVVIFQAEAENEEISESLRLAKDKINDIKNIFLTGGNIEDVCILLFISLKSCSTILMMLEVEGLLNIEECENERIIKLYQNGLTPKQIEKTTNFDLQRIREIIKINKSKSKPVIQDAKKRLKMAKDVNRMFEDLKYTKRELNIVRAYINLCKDTIKTKKFTDFELNVLKDSIEFVQGGLAEVCIYLKICILEKRYDSAIRMININSSNDKISEVEKMKLFEMKKKIEYIANLQRAFEKSKGITDYDQLNKIAQKFEIRVIDLLGLKKTYDKESFGNELVDELVLEL